MSTTAMMGVAIARMDNEVGDNYWQGREELKKNCTIGF